MLSRRTFAATLPAAGLVSVLPLPALPTSPPAGRLPMPPTPPWHPLDAPCLHRLSPEELQQPALMLHSDPRTWTQSQRDSLARDLRLFR